jgi:hypothetical protein
MHKLSSANVTGLSYMVFITSVVLFALAIAEISLAAVSLRAFRHFSIQIPGSNLAEWKFVDMDPTNIDEGTTSAKFAVGAAGLAAALLASLWVVLRWAGFSGNKVCKQHYGAQGVFADVCGRCVNWASCRLLRPS